MKKVLKATTIRKIKNTTKIPKTRIQKTITTVIVMSPITQNKARLRSHQAEETPITAKIIPEIDL